MTGYSHPLYASSFAEFGSPRHLTHSDGWIIERPIPGSAFKDGMGCYPIFSCQRWSQLEADLKELEGKLVSLSLVTDPFGNYSVDSLSQVFDICYLYKNHFVSDLSQPVDGFVHERYRRYARNAIKEISVEYCKEPGKYLFDWIKLYQYLIDRHQISGIRAFSENSFEALFSMPGVEMFIARFRQEIIGADIYIIDGEVGYAHLSAISPLGYELRARHALLWTALQEYSKSLRWISHGAGSGILKEDTGLLYFKEKWATGTRPVYFCGKVLDSDKYKELTQAKDINMGEYFPSYRKGEYT